MNKNIALFLGLTMLLISGIAAETEDAAVGEFSSTATVTELVGEKSSHYFENVIAADTPIEWDVYVPVGYDPESPAGVMVYVSPDNSGEIPSGWKTVMEDHNLIWIGANNSGNKIDGRLRVTYAILAPSLARKSYNIDQDRVYISGLSGGGRIASIVAPEYAHIFKGAVYNCGVNFWGRNTPKRLEQIKNNRYVFVTGSGDFNRRETKKAYKSYKKAGAENIQLFDIAHMGHENPNGSKFGQAIDFLDMRD